MYRYKLMFIKPFKALRGWFAVEWERLKTYWMQEI
jgi:hypothetical protein